LIFSSLSPYDTFYMNVSLLLVYVVSIGLLVIPRLVLAQASDDSDYGNCNVSSNGSSDCTNSSN
jgi:hypothetical protein